MKRLLSVICLLSALTVNAQAGQIYDVTVIEQAYNTLRDDSEAPGNWANAAGKITGLELGELPQRNVAPIPYDFLYRRVPRVEDLLRARATALLKTVRSLPPNALYSGVQMQTIDSTTRLTYALEQWEPRSGITLMRKIWSLQAQAGKRAITSLFENGLKPLSNIESMTAAIDAQRPAAIEKFLGRKPVNLSQFEEQNVSLFSNSWFEQMWEQNRAFEIVAGRLTELSIARWEAGDDKALNDYAGWLRAVDAGVKSSGWMEQSLVLPLHKYPNHPAIKEAIRILQGNKSSGSRHFK